MTPFWKHETASVWKERLYESQRAERRPLAPPRLLRMFFAEEQFDDAETLGHLGLEDEAVVKVSHCAGCELTCKPEKAAEFATWLWDEESVAELQARLKDEHGFEAMALCRTSPDDAVTEIETLPGDAKCSVIIAYAAAVDCIIVDKPAYCHAPFEASANFTGSRPGMVFKMGDQGLGYYEDGGLTDAQVLDARHVIFILSSQM